ncbi:MAG: NUDIX hydrolase [Bacilli bacterium]
MVQQYREEYDAKKELLEQREKETLAQYKPGNWRTPDGYTADIVLFTITNSENETSRSLQLMLIQRSEFNAENQGNIDALKWALPGGFIASNESAIQAAQRELKEETNVDHGVLQHIGTYDTPGRDPRGWVITNAFYAAVPEFVLASRFANDDASDVQLFHIDDVFQLPLAFDHPTIIKDAIQQLRRDMLQTDLAKNFLPKHFTLSELREVLLTVSSEKSIVEKSAFYRKAPQLSFLEVVKDTDGNLLYTTRNSKRPSKLYQFVEKVGTASIYY